MEQLYYYDAPHKYYGVESGIEYLPVSTVAHEFEAYTPWDLIKPKSAAKLGISVEELEAIWDKKKVWGTSVGTLLHQGKEDLILEHGFDFEGKHYEPLKYTMDGDKKYQLLDLPMMGQWAIPELITGINIRDKVHIAGTSDLPLIDDGVLHILDYKGLALDTVIPTTKGYTTMGEITKDDIVYDMNGKPTEIQHISEVHHNPCYELKFDTGDTQIADHEHKWEVEYMVKIKNDYDKGVKTTEEIHNIILNGGRVRIPVAKPIECVDVELPIDPYVLGYWLGNGNAHYPRITCMHATVFDEIERRGYVLGNDISNGDSGKAQERTIFGLGKELKALNLIKNKHIPIIYLRASYNQRLDLLRGLMDSDGYFNRKRLSVVSDSTRKYQVDMIRELLGTLGIKNSFGEYKGKGFVNGVNGGIIHAYYLSYTNNKVNTFLSRNNDYLELTKNKKDYYSKYVVIKNCKKVETVPTRCISVKSDTHTFLFSKNYFVCRNTDKAIEYKSKYNKYMNPPLQWLPDCNYYMYSLKMSMYMFFLLQQYPFLTPGKIFIIHEVMARDEDNLAIVENGIPKVLKEEWHEINYKKMEKHVRNALNYLYLKNLKQ